MSKLANLKAATSLSDLANLLGFRPKAVSYILYKQSTEKKYKVFCIPKRGGGHRTIKAPVNSLRLLQRRLADLLQDCMDEINASRARKDRLAHGFKRGRSIITNARQHRNRRWVFNIDLENFFPSINFGRVRGFLIKNRDFALNESVATVIAQIACHENSLPQGSPCSPVISNLVTHLLDMRLVKLASEAGCTYSRYADDLTFSTNKKQLSPLIAVPTDADGLGAQPWLPGEALRRAIERAGFRINANKTHLMHRASRQRVTGLIVNEIINVQREYRHNVRAMVHRLTRTGKFELLGVTQKDGSPVLEKREGTLNELHGMLGFIDSIDSYNKTRTENPQSHERSSREKVYREFLFYSVFYATQKPVIICEGITDNIYLTHAIRSLATEFPALAEVKQGGEVRLKVRIFKYRGSRTARLLGLHDGGSNVLSKFIAAYVKETAHFAGPGLTEPVIIVYDNDDGAKSILKVIKNFAAREVVSTETFTHVSRNLYAVPTPLKPGGSSSKVEDLFADATKAVVINGKTFVEENNFDSEKHYGKNVFANQVVRQRAGTIDFTGFRQFLLNIEAAINKHREKNAP